jgi:hypothetical protein
VYARRLPESDLRRRVLVPAFARVSDRFPALIAFASAPRDDVDEIIGAVAVRDFVARINVLDGAQDDLVPDRV